MPIPLSFAFAAMRAAKRLHTAPSFERPKLFRKIYFARLCAYAALAGAGAQSWLVADDRDFVMGE